MQVELLSCTPQLLHACSNCAMSRLLVLCLFRAPRSARRNSGGGAGVGSCTDHFGRSFAVLRSTGEPPWSCQQLCRPSWSCRHVRYATRSCWAQLSKYSIGVIKAILNHHKLFRLGAGISGYSRQFQRSCLSIPKFNGQLQISQPYSRVVWVMHMLYAQWH